MSPVATSWRELRAWSASHSAELRLCVRSTTAAVLTLAAAQLLHLPIALWAVLTAVILTQINAQPYSKADWHWRINVAHRFGHAAAAESVKGTLALLDDAGIEGEMVVRDWHEGRAEVVQMWGRPESVRRDFRVRRSL